MNESRMREKLMQARPRNRQMLRGWVKAVLGVEVPVGGRCCGHGGPIEYLERAFFEDIGSVAKHPGQGEDAMAGLGGGDLVDGKLTQRGVRLYNGSEVELLAQAQTSVRGQRVQKLRCDEAELFDEAVWEAAQFVTRSKWCGDVFVRGAVEVFSTMHRPGGLMERLVPPEVREPPEVRKPPGTEEASRPRSKTTMAGLGGWHVVRWCALDVMERCARGADCERCGLRDACEGRAKRGDGFLSLDDVLSQRRRSSAAAFETEMLCRRPSRSDCVFPEFDPAVHVRAVQRDERLMLIGGMDFGMRCPTVMLWAQVGPYGPYGLSHTAWARVEVLDEYVASDRVMSEHLRTIEERGWGPVKWVGVDPAGNQRNDQTGLSNVAMLRRAGWSVRSTQSGLAEGLEVVRRRLDHDCQGHHGLTEDGHPVLASHDADGEQPALVIHPRCERLIESLRTYHYDMRNPHVSEPVKDGPDHAVDALRYMLVNLESAARGKVQVRQW